MSLRFAEKLRNPQQIFEAQMKIPNKKVKEIGLKMAKIP